MSAPTPSCSSPIRRRRRVSTTSFRNRPMATGFARQRRRNSAVSVSPPRSATPRAAKGALLIPAFAVERTQELIVDLVDLMERGEVPAAPIFLDSPLAIHATEVFRKHAASLDRGYRRQSPVQFAASAIHRDRRRKQIDRQADRLSYHHRRQRHVRRRPHPASSQALAVERPGHRAAGRLSGARHPRPVSSGRRQGRPDPGRRDQGGRPHPHDR